VNWIQYLTIACLAATVGINWLTIRQLRKVNRQLEYETYNMNGHIHLLLEKLDGKRGVK